MAAIRLPDQTGDTLNAAISSGLGPHQPVVIIGKGGAGKSSVLARLAFLSAHKGLPPDLRSFRPILVSPSYYEGSLVKAIADTLRERNGVAVDVESMSAQLQSGEFLILFDGVSEIDGDKERALKEILRTAQNADYQGCRFVISTRPLEALPADLQTFELQGLTADALAILLPHYELPHDRELQVRRQLQSFGNQPIEPLLLVMALEQGAMTRVSSSRSGLYERYFRRLLRVENNQIAWDGWRTALETLSNWFLICSGNRGSGLSHESLMRLINADKGKADGQESLLIRLRDYYHLQFADGLELVHKLQAVGLLQGGRRWRFYHDTFEEFFAASWLVSNFKKTELTDSLVNERSLAKWVGIHERENDFVSVIDFVAEMADEQTKSQMLALSWPDLWKRHLLP
jgi:hypothetical protein